jgi:hypothetical protein
VTEAFAGIVEKGNDVWLPKIHVGGICRVHDTVIPYGMPSPVVHSHTFQHQCMDRRADGPYMMMQVYQCCHDYDMYCNTLHCGCYSTTDVISASHITQHAPANVPIPCPAYTRHVGTFSLQVAETLRKLSKRIDKGAGWKRKKAACRGRKRR